MWLVWPHQNQDQLDVPSALSADPHHLWLVTHFGLSKLHQKPHRFLSFRSEDNEARATLLARELGVMAFLPPASGFEDRTVDVCATRAWKSIALT